MEVKDLPDRLNEIKEKTDSYNRIEIVGKFFNPASGEIEYKLSNGRFISINGESNYELSFEEKIQMFGKEFIKEISDVLEYRDIQINDILNV